MGVEIERKFLVEGEAWRGAGPVVRIEQGYLVATAERSIRVRITPAGATITAKGPSEGASRQEVECEVTPVERARELLDRFVVGVVVRKDRHVIDLDGIRWEIDEFAGANAGLVVAELEAPDPDRADAHFAAALADGRRPGWLGREVTADPRYANARLALEPWSSWTDTT